MLLPLKIGTASVAALSLSLLATGSGGQQSTVDTSLSVFGAPPAYARDTALVQTVPAPSPAQSSAPATPPATLPATLPAPPVAAAPARPQPVAGLDQLQMDNAAIIVRQGKAQGMPRRALVVAVATAMQESDLHNVASSAVPSSLRLPHQGVSTDHDSVGLFQQRASQGWGTVPQLMDPAHSAMLFYNALAQVSGWERMSVAAAAQAVQRSAFPGAYQKHASRAEQVVTALA
ncbi:hypothetical protein Drose_31010 [Dactylosporangium roseum]|uniref:Secreted protein n=1 Tax=Dactylosporangium roseum TaxID=47989 RepID=A0ABY5Z0H1_9ACTN|nr:hypothetical protein [Dactylosporangium roseum]UWZ35510.1 hypothetical protein Drose_31010 [Dactylosporangium roseum]